MALALEEGGPDRTARALEQARQALRDALDPNRPEPADKAEIDRRMQELRDAIQKHSRPWPSKLGATAPRCRSIPTCRR